MKGMQGNSISIIAILGLLLWNCGTGQAETLKTIREKLGDHSLKSAKEYIELFRCNQSHEEINQCKTSRWPLIVESLDLFMGLAPSLEEVQQLIRQNSSAYSFTGASALKKKALERGMVRNAGDFISLLETLPSGPSPELERANRLLVKESLDFFFALVPAPTYPELKELVQKFFPFSDTEIRRKIIQQGRLKHEDEYLDLVMVSAANLLNGQQSKTSQLILDTIDDYFKLTPTLDGVLTLIKKYAQAGTSTLQLTLMERALAQGLATSVPEFMQLMDYHATYAGADRKKKVLDLVKAKFDLFWQLTPAPTYQELLALLNRFDLYRDLDLKKQIIARGHIKTAADFVNFHHYSPNTYPVSLQTRVASLIKELAPHFFQTAPTLDDVVALIRQNARGVNADLQVALMDQALLNDLVKTPQDFLYLFELNDAYPSRSRINMLTEAVVKNWNRFLTLQPEPSLHEMQKLMDRFSLTGNLDFKRQVLAGAKFKSAAEFITLMKMPARSSAALNAHVDDLILKNKDLFFKLGPSLGDIAELSNVNGRTDRKKDLKEALWGEALVRNLVVAPKDFVEFAEFFPKPLLPVAVKSFLASLPNVKMALDFLNKTKIKMTEDQQVQIRRDVLAAKLVKSPGEYIDLMKLPASDRVAILGHPLEKAVENLIIETHGDFIAQSPNMAQVNELIGPYANTSNGTMPMTLKKAAFDWGLVKDMEDFLNLLDYGTANPPPTYVEEMKQLAALSFKDRSQALSEHLRAHDPWDLLIKYPGLQHLMASPSVENMLKENIKSLKGFAALNDLYKKLSAAKKSFHLYPDQHKLYLGHIEGLLKVMGAQNQMQKLKQAYLAEAPETCGEVGPKTKFQAVLERLTAPTIDVLEATTPPTQCIFCFENLGPDTTFVHHGCGHASCRIDARVGVKVQLEKKEYPIYCPYHANGACAVEVDRADLERMGYSKEEIASWQLGELRHFLEGENETGTQKYWKFCKGSNCDQAYDVGLEVIKVKEKKKFLKIFSYTKKVKRLEDRRGVHVTCDTCGNASCLDCGSNHPDYKSCRMVEMETIKYIRQKVDDGTMKKCPGPNCHELIEKNQGCKHMTCRRCKHQFHWDDLSKWKGNQYHEERNQVKSVVTDKDIENYLK